MLRRAGEEEEEQAHGCRSAEEYWMWAACSGVAFAGSLRTLGRSGLLQAASHWRRLYTETTPWESSRQAVGAVSGGTWENAAAQAF